MKSIQSIIFSRFIVILTLLIFSAGLLLFLTTTKTLRQFSFEDNSRSFQFIAENIEANYSKNLKALDGLALAKGMYPFSSNLSAGAIQSFLNFESIFSSVVVYQKQGKLLISKSRVGAPNALTPEGDFREKWDRNFVEVAENVIASGKSQLTELFQSTKGQFYQYYIVPIKSGDLPEGGEIFGIVAGAVFYNNDNMSHLLRGLALGEENFILLSDRRGNPLLSEGINHPEHVFLLGPDIQQVANGFYDHDKAQQSASKDDIILGPDESYSMFFGSLPSLKLVLSFGVNRQALAKKESLLIKSMFGVLGLGLGISYLFSAFIGLSLARPFRLMAKAVSDIERGDFSHPILYEKNDEIGRLCGSINKLMRKIDKAEYLGSLWNDPP